MTLFQNAALPTCVLALAQPIGFWTNKTAPNVFQFMRGRGGTPIQTHCGEDTNVHGRGVVFGWSKESG